MKIRLVPHQVEKCNAAAKSDHSRINERIYGIRDPIYE